MATESTTAPAPAAHPVSRRTIITGAAAIPAAALAAPALALPDDPAFAAIEAHRRAGRGVQNP
jgi:hypothetical protein